MTRLLWGIGLLAAACSGPKPEAPAPEMGAWTESERATLLAMRLPATVRESPSNQWADAADAAALGERLFFDPGLSPAGVSCASCHLPEKHFTDGRPLGVGVAVGTRHTPSVVGSQWGNWFFWDGRADSLWAQALKPIESAPEMGSTRLEAVRHVVATYPAEWAALFGAVPDVSDTDRFPLRGKPGDAAWEGMAERDRAVVDGAFARIGKVIAAYERTLLPKESPFDRYLDTLEKGQPDSSLLGEHGLVGLDVFLRRGNCADCHHGPMLTDRAFHNLGLAQRGAYDAGRTLGAAALLASPFNCKGPHSDTPRCPELDFLDPSFEDFEAAFKTPTLRYVTETAPYMHDGQMETLDEVLTFYSELPGTALGAHRELTLQPLKLTVEEREGLKAFLAALSGEPVAGGSGG